PCLHAEQVKPDTGEPDFKGQGPRMRASAARHEPVRRVPRSRFEENELIHPELRRADCLQGQPSKLELECGLATLLIVTVPDRPPASGPHARGDVEQRCDSRIKNAAALVAVRLDGYERASVGK